MEAQYFQNFIRNYSDRLRLEGFTVHNILDESEEVPCFCGVQPTIYAKDDQLERLIVVRTEDKYDENSDEIVKLKEYTRAHHQASFWGFTTSDKSWRLLENII